MNVTGFLKKYGLILLITIHFLSHYKAFSLPAVGNHVWQQCNTLAVARNYFEEDMNLLKPRVDKRNNTPGITGPSFTAYEYLLACGYHLWGYHENLHRFYSWVLFALGILGFSSLLKQFELNNTVRFAALTAFSFSPELFYHSVNALPDVLALTCMIWGWYFFKKYLNFSYQFRSLIWATLLLALAGMVKMQFLVVVFPLCVYLFKDGFKWTTVLSKPLLLFSAFFIGLATISWYVYASHLTQLYGLHEFVHAMRHAQSLQQSFNILLNNIVSTLPETWLGYAWVLPFLFFFSAEKAILFKREWTAYSAGCLLYYFLIQYQFIHHGYYGFIFIPFLSVASGVGFEWLVKKSNYYSWLIIPLAVFLAYLRVVPSNWQEGKYRIPETFLTKEKRKEIDKYAPENGKALVGPDPSGCILLYYLHIKGYNLHSSEEWKGTEGRNYWKKLKSEGVQWFVTHRPLEIPNYVRRDLQPKPAHQLDSFYWFKLKTRNEVH